MADYQRATGTSGLMMVRDTGIRVEFWLKAAVGVSAPNMPWGYTINGTESGIHRFAFQGNGLWQMIKAWNVYDTQNVQFRIGTTGVGGLGGPTALTVLILRPKVPDTPGRPAVSSITHTSVRITWVDPHHNDSPISERQVGFRRTTSGGPTSIKASDKDDIWSGFVPGETVYFQVRAKNSIGWSPWSAATTVKFLDEPAPPGIVTLSEITQTSVLAQFTDASNGGTAILERQIGVAVTNGGLPTRTVAYSGPTRISNLAPGVTHYFRSRTRNAVGWSEWSQQTTGQLVAGAWVKVGGEYKRAVPYVKHNGVWRLARPWVRIFGFWQESS